MPETAMQTTATESTAAWPAAGPRVIAVASGKGGVGKTNLTANLAVTLGGRGLRVCVLDADLGLANVDVLFGLSPTRSLRDVVRGDAELGDVLVDGPAGIRIIPASSGFEELTRLAPAEQLRILDAVDGLERDVDVLLVDTGAGISSNVLYFAAAAAETLVVITPEPTALTDAYALVKVLAAKHGRTDFLVAVNMAAGAADAEAAFRRLARVAERFLRVRLEYQGYVPFDDAMAKAVRRQEPLVLGAPQSPASLAVGALADRLVARPPARPTGGLQFFFRQLVGEGRE